MSLKMNDDTNNPIGTRLKHEMRKRGLTSTELAKQSDVKTSFIYDVISGKSANPSTIKLARVAGSLGISLSYLAGFKSANTPSGGVANSLDNNYVSIIPLTLDKQGNVTQTPPTEETQSNYLFNPVWLKEQLQTPIANLRVASIRGDSMEPTLCHNDQVIIDVSQTAPSPPGIFILHDGFGMVAKRLEHLPEQKSSPIYVISDNEKYTNYECTASDIRIIGRIVWFSRNM